MAKVALRIPASDKVSQKLADEYNTSLTELSVETQVTVEAPVIEKQSPFEIALCEIVAGPGINTAYEAWDNQSFVIGPMVQVNAQLNLSQYISRPYNVWYYVGRIQRPPPDNIFFWTVSSNIDYIPKLTRISSDGYIAMLGPIYQIMNFNPYYMVVTYPLYKWDFKQ
jgi:hypothetical protein